MTARVRPAAIGTFAAIALLVLVAAPRAVARDKIPRVAFFGFSLINTSLEPTTPNERQRLAGLDELFVTKVKASGRFELVPVPPDLARALAEGPEIRNCNGCERDYAKRAGAEWAAWGTVQKVSNLILNINLYMEDAASGKMEFVKSVDIRGNTDESWRHGLDYMLRHYLLHEP